MSAPLVSIIIPCYNAEAFMAEAIRSALAQTYPSREVIVVDDGSDDGSLDVVRSFGEEVRAESTAHRGGSAARNHGLRLARGELIQFLDADDLLFPEKVERCVYELTRTGADGVFCDAEVVSIAGEEVLGRYDHPLAEWDLVVYCSRYPIQVAAALHRAHVLHDRGGFNEALPCSQERDLHLRLACEGMVMRHLPEVLVRVRKREHRVSANYTRVLDQHAGMIERACEKLLHVGTLTEERRKAFSEWLAHDARHYLKQGETTKARDYFRRAAVLHPSGGMNRFGNAYRLSARTLGPVLTERLAGLKGQGWRSGDRKQRSP